MTPPRTYAIFNAEGGIYWHPQDPETITTPEQCIIQFEAREWMFREPWGLLVQKGFSCRPIALVDPAKLDALLEAIQDVKIAHDLKPLNEFGVETRRGLLEIEVFDMLENFEAFRATAPTAAERTEAL